MKEKREKERLTVEPQPKGKLMLSTKDKSLKVQLVRDVSPFGVMVQINETIGNGETVKLIYQHKDIQLDVNGTVKWRKIEDDHGNTNPTKMICHAGISFDPEELELNLKFFNALIN